MGMSSGEIVRVVEEKSGCTRGGEKLREKRQRIGEGPTAIEVHCHEEQPHKTKRRFSDEEDDQAHATPRIMIGLNPSSNVSTPLCTTPPQGRNVHSMSTCPTC